jgi:hypothetical protein
MDSRAVNFGGLLFVGIRCVVGNQRQRADRRGGRRNLLLSNR